MKRTKLFWLLPLLGFLFFFAACEQETTAPTTPNPDTGSGTKTITIEVEGNEDEDAQTIVLTADAVSAVTSNSATVSGAFIRLNPENPVLQHGHCWSKTNTQPTQEDNKTELGEKTEVGIFTSTLENLEPSTTYYVRAYLVTEQGLGYHPEVSTFTTSEDTNVPAPIADFSYSPTSPTLDNAIIFTNNSTNATSYLWNFGDGNTSTASSPRHSYSSVGTYTVSLQATGEGGVSTASKTLEITDPTTDPTIPNSFTQRYYIEELTGSWCGWCPIAIHERDELLSDYPERVVVASIHNGDGMAHTNSINYLDNNYGISGYPAGLVNRSRSTVSGDLAMFPTEWRTNIENTMNGATSPVGFQVDTELVDAQGGTKELEINVRVGFGSSVTQGSDYRINIALLENNITEDQQNLLSGNADYSSHPYYSQPAVLTNFLHQKVYRRNITDLEGEQIPTGAVKAKGVYEITFTQNLARYVPENCEVVVFVTTGSDNHVENVTHAIAGQDATDW